MLFSKFNVNKGEWLDLVFADRNKSYGAYELRKYSDQYLLKAMLVSFVAFALFVIGPAMYYSYKSRDFAAQPVNTTKNYDDNTVFVIEDIVVPQKELPKTEQVLEVPASSQAAATVNVNQVKLTQQINVIENGGDLPTITEIKNAIIANVTITGTIPTDANLPARAINGTEYATGQGTAGNTGTVHDFAEKMPEFPGGMSAWSKFLNRNLTYPAIARETGIQGRVTVSFIVEKDGSLSNIKVLRGIGGGCDEEAIRVIKKSPFWKPGMQNGNPVRVSYMIPIVFALQ